MLETTGVVKAGVRDAVSALTVDCGTAKVTNRPSETRLVLTARLNAAGTKTFAAELYPESVLEPVETTIGVAIVGCNWIALRLRTPLNRIPTGAIALYGWTTTSPHAAPDTARPLTVMLLEAPEIAIPNPLAMFEAVTLVKTAPDAPLRSIPERFMSRTVTFVITRPVESAVLSAFGLVLIPCEDPRLADAFRVGDCSVNSRN